MSEYPPDGGWFSTPIPDIMLRQQERLEAAERRAERHDLAAAAIERHLAFEIARGNRLVSAEALLDLIGSGASFGESGLKSRGLSDALGDLEAELGQAG